jgi:hypothetical protein
MPAKWASRRGWPGRARAKIARQARRRDALAGGHNESLQPSLIEGVDFLNVDGAARLGVCTATFGVAHRCALEESAASRITLRRRASILRRQPGSSLMYLLICSDAFY